MEAEELKKKISKIGTWRRDGKRSPHKPLLILYALGRLHSDKVRYLPYADIKISFKNLLIDFGSLSTIHPEYPFVFLQNDGFWELNNIIDTDNYNAKQLSELIGYFNDDTYDLLCNDSNLIQEIAQQLLEDHFQESMYEDILAAVGLNFSFVKMRVRDSKFREKILRAYENRCAVCDFNVQLGRNIIAIEAAHIKWHKAGGVDTEDNGIALCILHHKLFDRGVFTFNTDSKLVVSEDAYGSSGFDDWLMRYHGKKINTPINPSYIPKLQYIKWHNTEVFKGKARFLAI